MSDKLEQFWLGIRGLICVCKLWKCNSYDCRLVQHMNAESIKKFNHRFDFNGTHPRQ